MKQLIGLLFLFLVSSGLNAQHFLEVCSQSKNALFLQTDKAAAVDRGIDVIHYGLQIKVDPQVKFISGSNTITFTSKKPKLSSVLIDISDSLLIDSIQSRNGMLNFTRLNAEQIRIDLSDSLALGQVDSLKINYRGKPNSGGLGTFVQDSYNGIDSIIWTLSQPYGASQWWPCVNNLSDKADSIDIWIETPYNYKAASIGLLKSVDSINGMLRHRWKSSYPIASYLVAFAVCNYEVHESYHQVGADSMLFQHFLYPGDSTSVKQSREVTLPFIQFFDSLFGPYPFINEKYGHASFTYGGGMEHQTMSFMGSYGGELIAHELAHQWFGDMVTCDSWSEIWLNEAFATYATMLTYEFNILHDSNYLPQVLQGFKNISFLYPHASVYRSDTSSSDSIFTRVPYYKGASLLHMLRFKLGDSIFFQAIRNYLQRQDLAYDFASTKDLQQELERLSGEDLTEFFKDWYYGSGYPTYTAIWEYNNNQLNIQLNQSQSDPSVYFFNMPVPYRVLGPNLDTTIILDPKFSGELFHIPVFENIDSIVFDPQKWIGAKSSVISSLKQVENKNTVVSLFPNPAIDRLQIRVNENIRLEKIKLLDSSGRLIQSFGVVQSISTQNYEPGTYILELHFPNRILRKPVQIQ